MSKKLYVAKTIGAVVLSTMVVTGCQNNPFSAKKHESNKTSVEQRCGAEGQCASHAKSHKNNKKPALKTKRAVEQRCGADGQCGH